MKVIQVFDNEIANRLRSEGWQEIKTQFDIEQQVWTFLLKDARPVCFDIDDAIKSGVCRIVDRFKMTF